MAWISPRDLEATGVRLFCLPHAGSGTAGFYWWKRLLPASVAVCPIALPGREARLGEPLLRSAAEIVEELHAAAATELARPYAIFGHSMGALLAFEWAGRIQAAGLSLPVALFVSGRDAPQVPFGPRGFSALPDEEFVAALGAAYGGSPHHLLADADMREVFLPILRADLAVVESYRFAPGEALRCPVEAFAGAEDGSVSETGLAAWQQVSAGEFSARRLPGDHFCHFGAGQVELLDIIAQRLSR